MAAENTCINIEQNDEVHDNHIQSVIDSTKFRLQQAGTFEEFTRDFFHKASTVCFNVENACREMAEELTEKITNSAKEFCQRVSSPTNKDLEGKVQALADDLVAKTTDVLENLKDIPIENFEKITDDLSERTEDKFLQEMKFFLDIYQAVIKDIVHDIGENNAFDWEGYKKRISFKYNFNNLKNLIQNGWKNLGGQ